jgi:hypothetical protein
MGRSQVVRQRTLTRAFVGSPFDGVHPERSRGAQGDKVTPEA